MELKQKIEDIAARLESSPGMDLSQDRPTIEQAIAAIDRGEIRVSSRNTDGSWTTHPWVKQAVLLYFRVAEMQEWQCSPFTYYDKIPLKTNFKEAGVRAVPPATARYGSYIAKGVVLMPSYVNIGSYVDEGTMVDTWATVGSCAQIGRQVHLSGGVGIGGVLEPPGAQPVIIEDGAFIGSRAIIVEGFRVGARAVVAANVTLTASTPIIDTREGKNSEIKGYLPENVVVVPGVKEKDVAGGKIFTSCAYIIGERKASTDLKTSLNDVLREFALSL